jgi:predicted nucleic acid-binding Zn ribbon protein
MNKRKPESIGAILESVLLQGGYLTACREQEVVQQWPTLVGEAVAAVTQCSRVENGIVYVRVSTAPWRQELSYMKGALLKKIRSQCETIREIVLY